MSRRTSLPGADELFRSTGAQPPASRATGVEEAPAAAPRPEPEPSDELSATPAPRRRRPVRTVGDRRPSGRERHDEKITVYVSADELLDLEHGRLALRGDHGLAVDRGRIVREALAVVLADLEAKGESSILVRRLRGR